MHKDIGPHEGIEFELIKQAKKDLALFFFDYPFDDHRQQAQASGLHRLWFDPSGDILAHFAQQKLSVKQNVIYYRTGYKQQAFKLMHTIQLMWSQPEKSQQCDRKIGQLLGYSEQQIQAYCAQQYNKQ